MENCPCEHPNYHWILVDLAYDVAAILWHLCKVVFGVRYSQVWRNMADVFCNGNVKEVSSFLCAAAGPGNVSKCHHLKTKEHGGVH